MEIDLFGKYLDTKQRLFIVIERSAKIEVVNSSISLLPSTVKVLNVSEETVKQFNYYEFLDYVKKGILIRNK